MVLTNFECWAHGGSENLAVGGLIDRRAASDLFNPATLQQQTCNARNAVNCAAAAGDDTRNVSHLSSNGYYGFVSCNENARTDIANSGTECVNNSLKEIGDGRWTGEHVVGPAESLSTNAMFCSERVSTLPEALVRGINGFDKRKRIFAAEEASPVGMESEMVKRCRYDDGWNGACNDPSNISLSYFAMQNVVDTDSAMDHEDIPVAPTQFVANQTVLNHPPQSNHVHYEQLVQPVAPQASPHPTASAHQNQIAPNHSLNKRKHNISTHIINLKQFNKKPSIIDHSKMEKSNSMNFLPDTNGNFSVYLPFNEDRKRIQSSPLFENMTKNRLRHQCTTNVRKIDQLKCTNANFDVAKEENVEEIHKYQNGHDDDDLLENLYLSLHGGSNRHVWCHLSNCIGAAEEI